MERDLETTKNHNKYKGKTSSGNTPIEALTSQSQITLPPPPLFAADSEAGDRRAESKIACNMLDADEYLRMERPRPDPPARISAPELCERAKTGEEDI